MTVSGSVAARPSENRPTTVDAINTLRVSRVISRTFASFHVAESSIFPTQRNFRAWFDSRRLL
jgi:hypothetical protein